MAWWCFCRAAASRTDVPSSTRRRPAGPSTRRSSPNAGMMRCAWPRRSRPRRSRRRRQPPIPPRDRAADGAVSDAAVRGGVGQGEARVDGGRVRRRPREDAARLKSAALGGTSRFVTRTALSRTDHKQTERRLPSGLVAPRTRPVADLQQIVCAGRDSGAGMESQLLATHVNRGRVPRRGLP